MTSNLMMRGLIAGAAAVVTGVAAFASGSGVVEITKLVADGPFDTFGNGHAFGSALAMDQGILVTSDLFDLGFGQPPGAVYVFDATTGARLDKIAPPRVDDSFNFGVALDIDYGQIVALSADGGPGEVGYAYVYDATTRTPLYRARPDDVAAQEWSQPSVSLGGGVLTIGSRGVQNVGQQNGAAFTFNAATGDPLAELVAPLSSGSPFFFGDRVENADGLAFVMGWSDAQFPADGPATVRSFDPVTGALVRAFDCFDPTCETGLTRELRVENGLLVTLRPDNGVYVFDADTGELLRRVTRVGRPGGDGFGLTGLDVDGRIAAVGTLDAPGDGSVTLFDVRTGHEIVQIFASDGTIGDRFGEQIALADGMLAVGASDAPVGGFSAGAMYLFDVSGAIAPCLTDVTFDGTTDLADLLAVLASFGTDADGDTNGDDATDLADLLAVLAEFGNACGVAP